MNRLAGNIDCRDARWRQHDYFFLRVITKIIEQRGFARARAAGNQQVLGRVFHQRKRPLEFGIEVNFDWFGYFSHDGSLCSVLPQAFFSGAGLRSVRYF